MATRAQLALAVDGPFASATAAGKARKKRGDYAISAAYEPSSGRLRIELASGIGMLIPVKKLQGLAKAKSADVKAVKVAGAGLGLYWPSLDLDLSVPDLIAGSLGSEAWMSALGRQAGMKTSKSKADAARRNGRKGGRPHRSAGAKGEAPEETEEFVD